MGASAFPKIYALGKVDIQDIFKTEVEITEKIDGSQFVFGKDETGEIVMRSKGAVMHVENHPNMFDKAVETVQKLTPILNKYLPGTYIYTEYLNKPKHNVLTYARTPKDCLIVFGVKFEGNFITDYDVIKVNAEALGLEVVPLLHKCTLDMTQIEKGDGGYGYAGYDLLKRILETTPSVLGGDYGIEGVVVKNYEQRTRFGDPTICCGKYVRESFKERHEKEWRTGTDKVREFIESFRTEARWQKAIQHLQEKGELEGSPRDIGKLMKEINVDISKEEEEGIKDFLFKHFIKEITRKAGAGFPEFYKDQLLKKAFEEHKNVV